MPCLSRRLLDFSAAGAAGNYGAAILGGAGWHGSKALDARENSALVRLPLYSPELNPVGQVFNFIKPNYLSNRMFETVEDVWSGIAGGWEKFMGDRGRVRSPAFRKRAMIQ